MKFFPKSHCSEPPESRRKIAEHREKIRNLVQYSSKDECGSCTNQKITDGEFREMNRGKNVSAILCSLDKFTDFTVTIMNCVFEKDGYVDPHIHSSHETVFVADGELFYEQENKTYEKGDVINIPPGRIHSFKSDYALLTITWRPAFKYIKCQN